MTTISEEAAKELQEKQKQFEQAFKSLEDVKTMALSKLAPVAEKNVTINEERSKVALTAGGAVMILFVSKEEAQKYFEKL